MWCWCRFGTISFFQHSSLKLLSTEMVGTNVLHLYVAACLFQNLSMHWWLAEGFLVCPWCFPVVLMAYDFHTLGFRLSHVLLYVLYLRAGCRSSWNESINSSLNSSMAYKYCSLLPQTSWTHSFVLFYGVRREGLILTCSNTSSYLWKKTLSLTDESVVV